MKYLLLLLPLTLLAQISGTFRVTGPVAPTATNSNYGAAVPVYNYGGLLTGLGSTSQLTNLNIYPLARRHAGQLAVLTNGAIYQLDSSLTNWVIYSKIDASNGSATGLSVSNLTVTGTHTSTSATITNLNSNAGVITNLNSGTAVITNLYSSTASISNLTTLDTLNATNITSTGNITITTAGKGLVIKDNANGRVGIATLNGSNPAYVIVTNSTVTTNTLIFLTRYGLEHSYPVAVTNVTSGASFTISSPHNGDTDNVFWMLVEKIP